MSLQGIAYGAQNLLRRVRRLRSAFRGNGEGHAGLPAHWALCLRGNSAQRSAGETTGLVRHSRTLPPRSDLVGSAFAGTSIGADWWGNPVSVQQVVAEAQGFDGGRLVQPALPSGQIEHLSFVLQQRPPDPIHVGHSPQRITVPSVVPAASAYAHAYQIVPVPRSRPGGTPCWQSISRRKWSINGPRLGRA